MFLLGLDNYGLNSKEEHRASIACHIALAIAWTSANSKHSCQGEAAADQHLTMWLCKTCVC